MKHGSLVRLDQSTGGFLSRATMWRGGRGGKLSGAKGVNTFEMTLDPTGGWACPSV